MSFAENIKKRFSNGLSNKEQEFYAQNAASRVLIISSSIWFLLISFVKFYQGDKILTYGALIITIILLATYLLSYEEQKIPLARLILGLSYVSYFILIFFLGDIFNNLKFFIPILPAIILLVMNRQKLSLTIVGFIFILLAFWFYESGLLKAIENIQYLMFYLIVIFFIFLHKRLFDRSLAKLQTQVYTTNKEIDKHKQFLEKISYQIRIPLNNIIGMNDFFDGTELDDIQQDYLDTINASAYMLLDVVELLEEKKERAQPYTEEESPFNIYLTLNNFEDFAKVQDTNILINIDIDKELPHRVIGNPIKLKQILFLLLESFKKINLDSKLKITIQIKLEKIEDEKIYFKLNFKKKGKTHIANISQIDRHSQDELINLLDIKQVKDTCNSINLSLYVEVEQDETYINLKGFFTKIISKASNKQEKEADKRTKHLVSKNTLNKQQSSDMNEILRSANILLVEDNLINQKVILLALETHVANIDVANNGKEALDSFGSNKYDLILMDVQMPVMDGTKAAQKIRELEKTSQSYTPIIAVTANALQGDRNICLEAGMDEYLTKPINIEQLKVMMYELIAKNIYK